MGQLVAPGPVRRRSDADALARRVRGWSFGGRSPRAARPSRSSVRVAAGSRELARWQENAGQPTPLDHLTIYGTRRSASLAFDWQAIATAAWRDTFSPSAPDQQQAMDLKTYQAIRGEWERQSAKKWALAERATAEAKHVDEQIQALDRTWGRLSGANDVASDSVEDELKTAASTLVSKVIETIEQLPDTFDSRDVWTTLAKRFELQDTPTFRANVTNVLKRLHARSRIGLVKGGSGRRPAIFHRMPAPAEEDGMKP